MRTESDVGRRISPELVQRIREAYANAPKTQDKKLANGETVRIAAELGMRVRTVRKIGRGFKPKSEAMQERLQELTARNEALERELAAVRSTDQRALAIFTEREKQVLLMLLRGLLGKQIAHELGIAERTVKEYRGFIYDKTETNTALGLMRWALINKVITPEML